MVTRGVLSEFERLGFMLESQHVKGVYKGYFIVLNLGWFDHFNEKVIRIHVMFEPQNEDRAELTLSNKNLLTKYDKKYSWFLNEMLFLLRYRFIEPTIEEIQEEIDKMILVLTDEELLPVSETRSIELLEKYKYWQEAID